MLNQLSDLMSPRKTAGILYRTTFTARNSHPVSADYPSIAVGSTFSNITGEGGKEPLLAL
ncbi:MAG TPA: hypothetical protein VLE19_04980 [Pyrinomonadaceae bacterium]|nr:hypothetical protein [Pyrinomonadaceae bacterium]